MLYYKHNNGHHIHLTVKRSCPYSLHQITHIHFEGMVELFHIRHEVVRASQNRKDYAVRSKRPNIWKHRRVKKSQLTSGSTSNSDSQRSLKRTSVLPSVRTTWTRRRRNARESSSSSPQMAVVTARRSPSRPTIATRYIRLHSSA